MEKQNVHAMPEQNEAFALVCPKERNELYATGASKS